MSDDDEEYDAEDDWRSSSVPAATSAAAVAASAATAVATAGYGDDGRSGSRGGGGGMGGYGDRDRDLVGGDRGGGSDRKRSRARQEGNRSQQQRGYDGYDGDDTSRRRGDGYHRRGDGHGGDGSGGRRRQEPPPPPPPPPRRYDDRHGGGPDGRPFGRAPPSSGPGGGGRGQGRDRDRDRGQGRGQGRDRDTDRDRDRDYDGYDGRGYYDDASDAAGPPPRQRPRYEDGRGRSGRGPPPPPPSGGRPSRGPAAAAQVQPQMQRSPPRPPPPPSSSSSPRDGLARPGSSRRGQSGSRAPPPPPPPPPPPQRDDRSGGRGRGRGRDGRGGGAGRGGRGGRSGRDGRDGTGRPSSGGRDNDHHPRAPVPENQRRTLALASVPVQHVSHHDLRRYFERTYRGVTVQYVCVTSEEECVVDPVTGLSTAYVKFRSHDDAVRVLDEIGKMSSGNGKSSSSSSSTAGGMEITIGEGNDMVGGIRVIGLHDSNSLGENKWVDRQKKQQHPQHPQHAQHRQGEDGGGGGRGGGQWNHQHEWDGYGNNNYDDGYYDGYDEHGEQQHPTQQSKAPPPPPPPRPLNPEEEKRRQAREESRRKRREQYEEARRVEEERRSKIAQVKADCGRRRRDLSAKVDKLSKMEDMTQKQLTLHKKMLGLIKDATDKAAKMREILDLQKKANETKKEVMSTQAEADALAKEEGERIKEINVRHQQEQRRSRQRFSLDKRSSTLVVTGFPFDCTFAEDAVRKHFVAALGGIEDGGDDAAAAAAAASNAIKSMEMEDGGATVVISFTSRANAEKAKAGGAEYQGSTLSFKWRHGSTPPSASPAGTGEDANQVKVEGGDGSEDIGEGTAPSAADEAFDDDDNNGDSYQINGDSGGDGDGDELMINYDYDEEEEYEEETRWR